MVLTFQANGRLISDWDHIPSSSTEYNRFTTQAPFCHDFDLSNRLPLPSPSLLNCVSQSPQSIRDFEPSTAPRSPFAEFLQHLISQLSSNPPSTIHRVIVPSLLSPAAYSNRASIPENVLQFLHSLRALLRKYPYQLAAIITFPLSLYPRTTGLTRWMEILNDGVIELAPFPSPNNLAATTISRPTMPDDLPQGMLKVHRLPILHEKGGGVLELTGSFDDMTFSFSRKKGLVIKPFNLPPIDANADEQHARSGEYGKLTKAEIEF
jgi:elongator complex protein 4